MASKKAPEQENLTMRIDTKFKRELAKEAEAESRNLTSYVLHLLKTHPARQPKKPS